MFDTFFSPAPNVNPISMLHLLRSTFDQFIPTHNVAVPEGAIFFSAYRQYEDKDPAEPKKGRGEEDGRRFLLGLVLLLLGRVLLLEAVKVAVVVAVDPGVVRAVLGIARLGVAGLGVAVVDVARGRLAVPCVAGRRLRRENFLFTLDGGRLRALAVFQHFSGMSQQRQKSRKGQFCFFKRVGWVSKKSSFKRWSGKKTGYTVLSLRK